MPVNEKLAFIPKWVLYHRVEAEFGYSKNAQDGKRKNGVWLRGIHWIKAPDGNIVYSLEAIESWLDGQELQHAVNQ